MSGGLLSVGTADLWGMVGTVTTIVVAVVAIGLSIRFYCLQTQQGQRIGLMVMSAVRTIQRHMPMRENEDESDGEWNDDYLSEIEPRDRFVKRGASITLTLALATHDPDYRSFQCKVRSPTDTVHRSAIVGAKQTSLVFPRDFQKADTKMAGAYLVMWIELEEWTQGAQKSQKQYRIAEDLFWVLP